MKESQTYPLRLPRSLKQAVERLSRDDRTSMNQFMATGSPKRSRPSRPRGTSRTGRRGRNSKPSTRSCGGVAGVHRAKVMKCRRKQRNARPSEASCITRSKSPSNPMKPALAEAEQSSTPWSSEVNIAIVDVHREFSMSLTEKAMSVLHMATATCSAGGRSTLPWGTAAIPCFANVTRGNSASVFCKGSRRTWMPTT